MKLQKKFDPMDLWTADGPRPGVYWGDEEGSGSGGSGDETFNADQLATAVKEAVDKAVQTANDTSKTEYDTKRAELLDETKKAKEAASKWKDLDFDQVSSVMKVYGESADAKLIADGKIDEVITKRIDTEKAKWDEERTTSKTALDSATTERDYYKGLYENKLADIQLRTAAEKAEVVPTAIDDIVTRGLKIFKVDSEGNLEARDEKGELMKTKADLLLTPVLFLEELKESAPHYWPASEGAGARGGASGGSADLDVRAQTAAKSGDMKAFREVREKQTK